MIASFDLVDDKLQEDDFFLGKMDIAGKNIN